MIRRARIGVLPALWTVLAWAHSPLEAQSQEVSAPRQLEVRKISEGAVRVDGSLHEIVWRSAAAGSDFTQRDPVDGSPASERTEVRVLYSDAAVYVGVRAFDSDAAHIVAEVSRRDRAVQADEIAIFFDSYFDRRTAFEFAVNPSGAIRDVYYQDEYSNDPSWDPVWEVETSRDSSGWTAEFRIPLTQLRYSRQGSKWGFQVMRRIQRKAERSYWTPYSKKTSGLASRFGTLVGLADLGQPVRLEVRPYSVTSSRTREARSRGLYAPSTTRHMKAGGDVKLGLTSSLTLDATVNPDFGQVEADPAVVNLSAFESFFPEKRPFFVEGSGLFGSVVQAGQVFYSRRIGRYPQGSATPLARGSVQIPEQTRIMGAAKLTGKNFHGFGIGLMSVVTAQEDALLRDSAGKVIGQSPVEPLTHYFVSRMERDFSAGSHTVGLLATAVNRRLTPELRFLRSASYVGIVDGVHRWKNAAYALRWNLGVSDIRGDRAAITAAQRSPFRYYQRPDAINVHLDTTRTSLQGTTASLYIGKETGSWTPWLSVGHISAGFDLNDVGFQYGADKRELRAALGYKQTRRRGILRDYQTNFVSWGTWNTAGELAEVVFPFVYVGGTFLNNWTIAANPMNVLFTQRCFSCLRGGPWMRGDPRRIHFVRLTTDRRNSLSLGLEGSGSRSFGTQAENWSGGPTVYWKVGERLNGSVAMRYSWLREPYQFVTSRRALDTARYIVADLQQKTGSITSRLNWTANPKLSFEVYGQPFVSAGAYSRFQTVVDPRAKRASDRFSRLPALACNTKGTCSADYNTDGTSDLSFGQPDFRFLQLRATTVVRWEYRAGSTLFFAWQHGKTGTESDPVFGGLGSFADILRLHPDNTLLIKANYWVGF